jgi:hypothetical protein
MKASIALTIATLGMGLSAAAFAQTENAPPPKTWPGMACMVGLEPPGCETVFKVGVQHTNCAVEYTHRALDNCPDGPLEAIQYFGIDADGDDVYAVNWMTSKMTYIIAPPAPDGKIHKVSYFDHPPNFGFGSSIHSLETLYTRPKQED